MNRSIPLMVITAALVLGNGPDVTHAGEAMPKRPDTPAHLKPEEVVFTTSVVPARATPGETVTYRVTAKLEEPWHIYAYAKAQPMGPGPLRTRFDFFDPAGLDLVGDWMASREPDRKQEHQGEVTWSTRLKVPDNAAPGGKTLRCQAYFMICDANRCKPPARSTLPDATLTVLAADPAR